MSTAGNSVPQEGARKTPKDSLVRRIFGRYLPSILVVLVLCGLGLMEWLAGQQQRHSVGRIKAWVASLPKNSKIMLSDLETHLSGYPRRHKLGEPPGLVVTYTWPTVVGVYRLRARVRQDGSVLYADLESVEDEDFMTPFLAANEGGVRIKDGEQNPPTVPAEAGTDLVAAAQNSFRTQRLVLMPRLVVFPIVDVEGTITKSGPGLSMIAQNSLVYTNRRRMNLDPCLVRRTLIEAQCWVPGTKLDQPQVDACLRILGVERYVRPVIKQHDQGWLVQFTVKDPRPGSHTALESYAQDLNQLPGIMTLKLFEYLKNRSNRKNNSWSLPRSFTSWMKSSSSLKLPLPE